jgi:hypothetical protein
MKIEKVNKNKISLSLTPRQLSTIFAALDSVSFFEGEKSSVYADVPKLYEVIRAAVFKAEREFINKLEAELEKTRDEYDRCNYAPQEVNLQLKIKKLVIEIHEAKETFKKMTGV